MSTETDTYLIDASGAVKGLEDVAKATDKSKAASKGLGDYVKDDLKNAFFSAQAQYDILKRAASGLADIVIKGVKDFHESELVVMRHRNAMENAGYASAGLTQKLFSQADAIEKLTGVSDEEVKSLQTMLMTMGVAEGDIARVTQAAYDLATATGMNATSAARTLAKASAEGKEELKKFGITVKETANEAEGFEATLLAVEKRFGGMSSKIPQGIQEMNALKQSWNSFSEAVGQATMETISFGGASNILGIALDYWGEALTGNKEKAALAAQQAATLLAIEKEAVAEMDKLLGIQRDDRKGVNLGTLPAFNVSKEAAANEADAKRRRDKAQADRNYAAKIIDEETTAWEAKAQAERATEFGTWEDIKAIKEQQLDYQRFHDNEMFTLLHEANEKIRTEERKRLEESKQHWREVASEIKGYAQQTLAFGGGLIKEALLSDTAFTRAKKEKAIERELIGVKEEDAAKKRVEIEKRLAEEQKASLAQRTADFLANIALQAGIRAVQEAASAIASAASYDYAAAGEHAAAALAFGAVAVAAGGAAAAISSGRGMTAEERSSLSDADKDAADERRKRDAKNESERGKDKGAGLQQNVYYLGITGATDAEQGRELERLRAQYDALKTGSK